MLTIVTSCDMLSDWNIDSVRKGGEKLSEVKFDPEKLKAAMDAARPPIGDTALARKVGISRQMIFLMKKGERNGVSAEILGRIAQALNVPLSDLMTGDVEDGARDETQLPEAIRQIALIANRLSEVRQDELLRIATTLEQLEREQPTYAMPVQVMDILLKLAEKVGAGDVLLELRAMIPRSTTVDSDLARDGDGTPDSQ